MDGPTATKQSRRVVVFSVLISSHDNISNHGGSSVVYRTERSVSCAVTILMIPYNQLSIHERGGNERHSEASSVVVVTAATRAN